MTYDVSPDVQAIYDETEKGLAGDTAQAAAEETEQAAAPEVAAPVDEAAAVAAEGEEETTEEIESDSSDETPAAGSEAETFSDLLSDIPDDETLKPFLTRIPEQSKQKMTALRDGWQRDREALDKVGGREAVEILEPIANLLTKAERTGEDHQAAFAKMIGTNPIATTEFLTEGALNILFNRENAPFAREAAKVGDHVLQTRFGATSDELDKLVMLKDNGYIDLDKDMALLSAEGAGSQLFQSQSDKLTEQQREIDRLKDLVANPVQTATPAKVELDVELDKLIGEGIDPARERVRWGKDSALANVVKSALLAELKGEPEYREAVKLVEQQGLRNGEALQFNVSRHLNSLVNKARARFIEKATSINKDLKSNTERSINAQQAEKQKETAKPQPKPLAPSVRTGTFGGVHTLDPELADIYANTDAKRAAGV